MRNYAEMKVEVVNNENITLGKDPDDFVWEVRYELLTYLPKIEKFAKTHSKEKCVIKTGTWQSAGLIFASTKKVLDDYVRNTIFAGA